MTELVFAQPRVVPPRGAGVYSAQPAAASVQCEPGQNIPDNDTALAAVQRVLPLATAKYLGTYRTGNELHKHRRESEGGVEPS